MPIPAVYRRSSEVGVSYDSTDVASGRGMVVYFGGKCMSGANYILDNSAFYSDVIITSGAGIITTSSEDFKTVISQNFDLSFNKNNTINGASIVNIPIGGKANADTANLRAVASILHVNSAGAEKFLVSGASSYLRLFTNTPDATIKALRLVIPQTTFSKNEKLRLKVEVQSGSPTTAPETVDLAHDPQGRAAFDTSIWASTDPTKLTIHVPFKIDL